MELTLPAGSDADQGMAKEVREGGREAARSVLGPRGCEGRGALRPGVGEGAGTGPEEPQEVSPHGEEAGSQAGEARHGRGEAVAGRDAGRETAPSRSTNGAVPRRRRRRRGLLGLAFTPGAGPGWVGGRRTGARRVRSCSRAAQGLGARRRRRGQGPSGSERARLAGPNFEPLSETGGVATVGPRIRQSSPPAVANGQVPRSRVKGRGMPTPTDTPIAP